MNDEMLAVAYEFAASSYRTHELLKVITERYEDRFSDDEIWDITLQVLNLRENIGDHPEIGDLVKFNHWDTGIEYTGKVIIADFIPENGHLCVGIDTGKTGRYYPSVTLVKFV